jgi:hypothetical protein
LISQRNLSGRRQDPLIAIVRFDRGIQFVPTILRRSLLPLLLGLTVVACGGGGGSPLTPGSTATSSTTSTTSSSNAASPAAGSSQAAATGSIDANNATQAELAAAFAAAGISNADRWAREVAEYRPYEADPTWARLRQELGKYNIDPAVLEQILALLRV